MIIEKPKWVHHSVEDQSAGACYNHSCLRVCRYTSNCAPNYPSLCPPLAMCTPLAHSRIRVLFHISSTSNLLRRRSPRRHTVCHGRPRCVSSAVHVSRDFRSRGTTRVEGGPRVDVKCRIRDFENDGGRWRTKGEEGRCLLACPNWQPSRCPGFAHVHV